MFLLVKTRLWRSCDGLWEHADLYSSKSSKYSPRRFISI